MNTQKLKKLIKTIIKKPRLLYNLISINYYTITDLILLKTNLVESLKTDRIAFQNEQPSHKKYSNEELFAKAAKVYDIEKKIEKKEKDLQNVTLKILEFNVKSKNNITIQKLSFCTGNINRLKKSRKKSKYSYTAFYKKLEVEQRLQKLIKEEQNLKNKLSSLNDKSKIKLNLSNYSKELMKLNVVDSVF